MKLRCLNCGNEFESKSYCFCYVCLGETEIIKNDELEEFLKHFSNEEEKNFDWIFK